MTGNSLTFCKALNKSFLSEIVTYFILIAISKSANSVDLIDPWVLTYGTERHIWVNTGKNRTPYSVIFLARIACKYVQFELPADYLELAQTMLKGYFEKLEAV
ncbi:hypothetical protein AU255_02975 [Methyloprofundus sedimenti]|uniref:Uncharacterized protein n=1 Tax=Methyloprofundus sedimenti TaxID=1420851 RepID=A0A1V8M5N8_9GAMM|nr:hypothetical protein AU255_02975 [Methyloprofundus sedimenti]